MQLMVHVAVARARLGRRHAIGGASSLEIARSLGGFYHSDIRIASDREPHEQAPNPSRLSSRQQAWREIETLSAIAGRVSRSYKRRKKI